MIIAVFGLPGSGKSFFAGHLAQKLNAAYVSSDVVRKNLLKRGQYDETAKMEVYRAMLALMETAVHLEKDVVLDATFYKENIRLPFKQKANELNCKLFFIEIQAAEQLIKSRIKAKRADSEADFGVYLDIKRLFEPLNEDHLILSSDGGDLSHMLAKALQYINNTDGTG